MSDVLDNIFKFPIKKEIQDLYKSDFTYYNGQYIIYCQHPYATRPQGMAIDREDWDEFDIDLIRRIIHDKVEKSKSSDFNYIKTGVRESKFLKENFSDYCKSRNIL